MPEKSLEWSPELTVGIGDIDVQHRKIIRKINEISEAVKGNRSKEAVHEAIKFLEIYAQEHFSTEEMFMINTYYPDTAAHKKLHEEFLKNITVMKEELETEEAGQGSVLKATRQVYGWFENHITHIDMKMGAYLKTKLK